MVATSPEREGLGSQCLRTEASGVDERSSPSSVGAGRGRLQSEWLSFLVKLNSQHYRSIVNEIGQLILEYTQLHHFPQHYNALKSSG